MFKQEMPCFGYRIYYDRVVVGKKIDESTGEAKNIYYNKFVCFACETIQIPTTSKLEKMYPRLQWISVQVNDSSIII